MNKLAYKGLRVAVVSVFASVLALPILVNAQALEEIVVTATKREESLQDIPISITAQSGERLAEMNMLNPVDMATFTPSLSMVDQVTGISTVMRGVGTTGGNPAFEPSVATFIDGAYLGRDRTTTTAFLDMERIEVVRGPQPLFAGQNAVAGALNLISKRPGDEWEGYFRLAAGSDEENALEFAYGGPVSDSFGFRIAAIYDERGGWVDNPATGIKGRESEDKSVRATFVFEPTDELTITAIGTVYDSLGNGSTTEVAYCEPSDPGPGRGLNHCTVDPETGINDVTYDGGSSSMPLDEAIAAGTTVPGGPFAGLPATHFAGNPFPAGGYDNDIFVSTQPSLFGGGATERREQDGTRFNLIFDYVAEMFDFHSQTNFIEFDFEQNTDVDGTSLGMFHVPIYNDYEVFQQEFRLTSNETSDIEWMAGLYYQDSTYNNNNPGAFIGVSAALLQTAPNADDTDWVTASPFPNDSYFSEDAEWLSGYVNLGFQLSDTVKLEVGGRYTDVSKTAVMQNGTGYFEVDGTGTIVGFTAENGGTGCDIGTELTANTLVSGDAKDPDDAATEICVSDNSDSSSFDPQVVLSWDATEDTMVFARFAEGFKSAGFSVGMSAPDIDEFAYAPEEATTYELGFKSSLLDGQLELNVTAFHTETENRQVSALSPVFTGAPEFIIQNAAQSTAQGLEFDGRYAATDNLMLTFSGSILDSSYDNYEGASCNDYLDERELRGCSTLDPVTLEVQATFDASGLDTELANPWELALGARYTLPVADGYELTINGDLSLIDYDPANSFSQIQEGAWSNETEEILNLRLAYGPMSGEWEVAAYADNVTDNRPFIAVGSDAIGYQENVAISRRQGATYGVQLRYNFGE